MIVVDASAVVAALTREAGAEAVRTEMVADEMHAPTLLDHEVVAALRGVVLGGHLSASSALDALDDFDELSITRWSSVGALRRRTFVLRDAISPYDAAYVSLAEALDCPLLTRDGRLARSTGHDAEIWLR